MFRTTTGQTGMDAYKFEAAAIANAQRDLDNRFKNLLKVIHEEDNWPSPHKSDFGFSGADAAEMFCEYLRHGCRCSRCEKARQS